MSAEVKRRSKIPSEIGLKELQTDLLNVTSTWGKLEILKRSLRVQSFINHGVLDFSRFSEQEQVVFFSLIVLNQGEEIFSEGATDEELKVLAKQLVEVERFYKEIGGLIGYHLLCLQLLREKKGNLRKGVYHRPRAHDISKQSKTHDLYILKGIQELGKLAEIYPIGGAADRLSVQKFQVAATFEFARRTLLQRLIDDVCAREYLHYKLFGHQVHVPLVMMTSDEKDGDEKIKEHFEQAGWFGRDKKDVFLFSQPLVPSMTKEGKWCVSGPGRVLLKPGGHGVIWKLAKESGALKWLRERGKKKAFVRQINNLVAGVDDGILAFLGIGFEEGKDFGFAACRRIKGLSEGVDIVIETEEGYSLTNIEYCELEHFQVDEDHALYANTNLLFVDLDTVEELLLKNPIPGMLVNSKKMKLQKDDGTVHEEEILRLESTMQNLADALIEKEPGTRSYITCNDRKKTISTLKREFALGETFDQTPEQCYQDIQANAYDLLTQCGYEISDPLDFVFDYHPALGPMYSIISQKLRNGQISKGSVLELEISTIDVESLELDGALRIRAAAMMGHKDEKGILRYSDKTGKCSLKNVKISNSGPGFDLSPSNWKNERGFKECCEIVIEEGGEFYSSDLMLAGNLKIFVPKNTRVVATIETGKLKLIEEALDQPTWKWDYQINSLSQIILHKKG